MGAGVAGPSGSSAVVVVSSASLPPACRQRPSPLAIVVELPYRSLRLSPTPRSVRSHSVLRTPYRGSLLPRTPCCAPQVTRGFPLAMVANGNTFPDGGGYRVPVRTAGVVTYEAQPDERLGLGSVPGATDVVCFRSRAADAAGFHSLVETDVDVQRQHARPSPNRTTSRQPLRPTPTPDPPLVTR